MTTHSEILLCPNEFKYLKIPMPDLVLHFVNIETRNVLK